MNTPPANHNSSIGVDARPSCERIIRISRSRRRQISYPERLSLASITKISYKTHVEAAIHKRLALRLQKIHARTRTCFKPNAVRVAHFTQKRPVKTAYSRTRKIQQRTKLLRVVSRRRKKHRRAQKATRLRAMYSHRRYRPAGAAAGVKTPPLLFQKA